MQLFPPHYLTPAECTKEQNDQIQESDVGASVRVSGQNRQRARVCSMFHHTVSGTLVRYGETIIVPFNPTRWRHQCRREEFFLGFNVGVSQKQELFLEFNVRVSQKQEPKGLVSI